MQLSLSFLSRLFRNQQYFSAAKVIYDWGSARASGAVRPLTDVRYQACGELLLLETPRFAFVPSFTFTFVNLLSLSSISFQRYNAFAFCESIFHHFHEIAFNLGESFQSVITCSWCSCSFFSELVTLSNILAFPSAQLNFQFCNFFALLCPMLVSTIGSCSLAQFNHGVPNWDSQLNSIPCFHRHWDKDLLDEHLLDHQTFKGSPHSIE